MALTGAMSAGISGLKAHMDALNVVGNNVANVNTQGYKPGRVTFMESIYSTQSAGSAGTATVGGTNPRQTGYGVGIGTIDLDTLTPLTNADTKVGMRLLVTMTPAHPHWWDEDHKAYTCWLPELERVGMKGDQVRY